MKKVNLEHAASIYDVYRIVNEKNRTYAIRAGRTTAHPRHAAATKS